jgi:hypothetical protein
MSMMLRKPSTDGVLAARCNDLGHIPPGDFPGGLRSEPRANARPATVLNDCVTDKESASCEVSQARQLSLRKPSHPRKALLERLMLVIGGQRLRQIVVGGLLALMAMLGALIDSIAPF